MSRRASLTATLAALAALAAMMLLPGCDAAGDGSGFRSIDGTVRVAAGRAPRVAESINGAIHVDDNAVVSVANSLNGAIRLGQHAGADTLHTVNGSISVGAGARVARSAVSVNGGITLQDGAEVLGGIDNVNGNVDVMGAHVAGGIRSVNGNVTVTGASRVDGGIHMQKAHALFHEGSVPRIEIGPGATITGSLRFDREVKLYVSDRATIGPVTGAAAIEFTGDSPPAD